MRQKWGVIVPRCLFRMVDLIQLYNDTFPLQLASVQSLGGAASNRRYYRIHQQDGGTLIGVVGENAKENHAFLTLARHMYAQHLPVPRIYAVSADEMRYIQEDLGQLSLYDVIRKAPDAPATHELLRAVMRALPRVQYLTAQGFDFERDAFREPRFCLTTVRWDFNYFKYCFLKLTGYPMDELRLEDEFESLTVQLLDHSSEGCEWGFLYRDFQSRNVMVRDDGHTFGFIDFQGGYMGPIYYDVASFLWQTRAGYSPALRQELICEYLTALSEFQQVDAEVFCQRLYIFAFFRLLQTLGTYGYRGLFEHKAMFQTPICQALQALVALTPHVSGLCPYLCQVLAEVSQMERFNPPSTQGALTVRITSFSYKRGIPEDLSGNGGGFVFDCRAPLNPGRFAFYKKLTGLDAEVIDFLEGRRDEEGQPLAVPTAEPTSMQQFVQHVYALVDPAVQTYLDRGFTSLVVNCGCTGGQHRSVYCAQHLADHLSQCFPAAHIILHHREQQVKREYN